MFVENKIKGIFVWTLVAVYFAVLFTSIYLKPSINISTFILVMYVSINLLLGLIGIYIYRMRSIVNIWNNLLIILIIGLSSSILIYFTDGVKGSYFPFMYLIMLIYASLNRNKKVLYMASLFTMMLIIIWLSLSSFEVKPSVKSDYILYLIILFLIIIVIKNYPLKCLSCSLVSNDCQYSDSCVIKKLKNNTGVEKNAY